VRRVAHVVIICELSYRKVDDSGVCRIECVGLLERERESERESKTETMERGQKIWRQMA